MKDQFLIVKRVSGAKCIFFIALFMDLSTQSICAQVPPNFSSTLASIDSSQLLEKKLLRQKDSLEQLSRLSISLRDSINQPKPRRPEQIRADRREHAYAAGAVALLATLTFILYNLRTQ